MFTDPQCSKLINQMPAEAAQLKERQVESFDVKLLPEEKLFYSCRHSPPLPVAGSKQEDSQDSYIKLRPLHHSYLNKAEPYTQRQ